MVKDFFAHSPVPEVGLVVARVVVEVGLPKVLLESLG